MDDRQAIFRDLNERLDGSSFHRAFGLRLLDAERGTVRLGLDVGPEQLNLQGLVHGGVLATLADTAMGLAVRSAMQPDRRHVTIELGVHYLRPAHPGHLVAIGRAVRVGTQVAYAEADVLAEDERLLARANGTYAVGALRPEQAAPDR